VAGGLRSPAALRGELAGLQSGFPGAGQSGQGAKLCRSRATGERNGGSSEDGASMENVVAARACRVEAVSDKEAVSGTTGNCREWRGFEFRGST
jgi:hypothetical protein